jgi:negative regulator of sigma E activity
MEDHKEAWSAFIDGELSELEELRLVRQSDFAQVGPSVHRWASIRDQLRSGRKDGMLSSEGQAILNQRISRALDAEIPAGGAQIAEQNRFTRSRILPFAAAASIVLALTLGLFLQSPSYSPDGAGSASSLMVDTSNGMRSTVSPAVQNQVNNASQAAMLAQAEPPELKALDEETQARLRRYLEEHDRSVGLRASNPQFVGYPATTK